MPNLEDTIKYTFNKKELLEKALTHSSYSNEHKMNPLEHNERLEFLGDAVLELTVSEYLFNKYIGMSEGEMTKLRASVVCESMLAKIARKIKLGSYLKMGRGEDMTGGRKRDSILSDGLEALFGAVYKDSGFEEARKLILSFLVPEIERMQSDFSLSDCKTYLQEKIQQSSKIPIEYKVINETGPDHDKMFNIQVEHMGKILGKGRGKNKKEAEQNAALDALKKIGY